MREFELYCFAESGNAYKVALMLELAGADWQARAVDFFKGETRSPGYREAVNEMGEAPVLVHGARTLTQSAVILDYLSGTLGRFGWTNDDERREVQRWLYFDNHKFTSYNATLRFLLTFAKSGETPVTEFLRARARAAMDIVDAHLETRDFVALGRPTIADLSMAGYMFYDGELGIDLSEWKRLDAWRGRIRQMPGWRGPYELMPRAAGA